MKIGYARVSTPNQKLDRQIITLKAEGCERIYSEKQSGKSTHNRPELTKAINALGVDDVLILAEWDRATRSMRDGITIMEQVFEKGASLKALDRQWLDLTSPIGKGILAFLSALAEDDRQRIVKRAHKGRQAAVARGVRFGAKPKLTPFQCREIRVKLGKGATVRELAQSYNVSASTIQRIK